MKVEIKRWDTDEIIVCGEYESIKNCLEKNKSKSFYRANLRCANLSSADLSSANLICANLSSANLICADLSSANLRCADLSSADLSSADLSSANLRCANLICANLSCADLRSANLICADLRSAECDEPLFLPDLYSLKLLPKQTKLRFWKYLKNGESPYQHTEYKVGKIYNCKDYNSDETILCDKGLNVATLTWCLKDKKEADEFIEVEFKVSDIVAIPFGTDGKFRVKSLKVIKKIDRKQAVKLLKKTMGA